MFTSEQVATMLTAAVTAATTAITSATPHTGEASSDHPHERSSRPGSRDMSASVAYTIQQSIRDTVNEGTVGGPRGERWLALIAEVESILADLKRGEIPRSLITRGIAPDAGIRRLRGVVI